MFFLTFDENDGFFDHLPPPAPPSYNADGTPGGQGRRCRSTASTSPTRRGHYLNAADTISGTMRPWGLSARVPMYVISPWSKGGWVNSQVFDHTSVGMFLEKRFGVTVDAISPWHRAVCGDLTSCFDFASPNDPACPKLPDTSNWAPMRPRRSRAARGERAGHAAAAVPGDRARAIARAALRAAHQRAHRTARAGVS